MPDLGALFDPEECSAHDREDEVFDLGSSQEAGPGRVLAPLREAVGHERADGRALGLQQLGRKGGLQNLGHLTVGLSVQVAKKAAPEELVNGYRLARTQLGVVFPQELAAPVQAVDGDHRSWRQPGLENRTVELDLLAKVVLVAPGLDLAEGERTGRQAPAGAEGGSGLPALDQNSDRHRAGGKVKPGRSGPDQEGDRYRIGGQRENQSTDEGWEDSEPPPCAGLHEQPDGGHQR